MEKNVYKSYPQGYRKLARQIIPWYFRPMKDMLMGLLLTILTDG